ncbi:MAG: peptidoglycan DD-metalloendopeptidase family protein [Acidimicrobiia bacterium]|nr:peptidoglycan DD-metalloendopeptidase family protein [Acidimicrobiia bacterium]
MLRPLLLVLALAQGVAAPATPSPSPPSLGQAQGPAPVVRYHRPVRAPLVDRFRVPAGPYGAGNRGWEYETTPSTVVRASAGGTVAFAGTVAGELYVSVLHADGLRSTYSYLARISVSVGQVVHSGQQLGATGHRFQVGFRRGEAYVDPALLFGPVLVRLVPDERFAVAAGSPG